jgi:hypothetical protein
VYSKAGKGALLAVPVLIVAAVVAYLAMRPELTLVVDAKESTLPNDVQEWLGDAARAIRREIGNEQDALDKLKEELSKSREWLADADSGLTQVSPESRAARIDRIQRLEADIDIRNSNLEGWRAALPVGDGSPFARPDTTYWQSRKASVLTLTLTNESDDPINDIRIRVKDAGRVWRMHGQAEFLSSADRMTWENAFEPLVSFGGEPYVLPTIRQLPAGQKIVVSLWGDVGLATAEVITAHALRVKTIPVARVFDSGVASLFLHTDTWITWWQAVFIPIIGAPLWLLLQWVWAKEKEDILRQARREVRDEAFGDNLYTIAKYLAEKDSEYHAAAVVVLMWAEKRGYTKKQIREDQTFEPLWANSMFRHVFGDPAQRGSLDTDNEKHE